MGLFSKKSDKMNKDIDSVLPKLPAFPEPISSNYRGTSFENFPSYTPTFPTQALPPGGVMEKKREFARPKMHVMNGEEKPLFVRIENYKDAMKMLERIKEELKRTDEVLEKLNEIRNNEERELEAWHSEVRKLKDRLLEIDRKLFESEEA